MGRTDVHKPREKYPAEREDFRTDLVEEEGKKPSVGKHFEPLKKK